MSASVHENVSRETLEKLRAFEALVQKWTQKINLVSKRDADLIWDRHIVDSIQIYELAPKFGNWLDIGSGGGFPGIVAAILSSGENPERKFTLVDSDQRKCAFLRTAARELGLNVQVISARIDELERANCGVLSARALDELVSLLGYAHLHLASDGIALFPKGATWQTEHIDAQKRWAYDIEVHESTTKAGAAVLKIKELSIV